MKTLIIAEAGVNHNGSLELAMRMVDEAQKCGADIIKFQTAKIELLVTKYAMKAEYQSVATGSHESQYKMLKRLILSYDEFITLSDYCYKKGMTFLSTPFDLDSIDFLDQLHMPFWKVPSGEITNLPYLEKIARTNKPIVMSTGMCTLEEIESAIKVLRDNNCGDITLLHCTTEYPAPYRDVNLKAMNTLRDKFKVPVGYSDHTNGIEVAIAAVALGAVVIEKHFTLDKSMEGPDHKASLESSEFATMVNAIRNIELSMGSSVKKPVASEINNLNVARKSIIAKCEILKGEVFTQDNITVKRPGNGISPMNWYQVLGRTAIKNFEEDELIEI